MSEPTLFRVCVQQHIDVLRRNLEVLERMCDGMDESQAGHAPIPGASTLHWLVGHLLAYRDIMLTLAGGDPIWDEQHAAGFKRGTTPVDAPTVSLPALLALLRAQQAPLEAALTRLDDATLAAPGPRGPLADDLAFRVWHDTYHAGQAVLYRRAAGLPSPIG